MTGNRSPNSARETATVRFVRLYRHLRGDARRSYVRLLYRLLAPLYDWVIANFMPDYGEAAGELLDRLELTANDRILDLGAGTGVVTLRALERARFVVALDMTPGMLRQLGENAPEGRPLARVRADARHLPFPAGSFDVVTTAFMLLHLTDEEKQQVLREARRVLGTYGRFGALTGSHETAAIYPTPDQWQTWLHSAGFSTAHAVAHRDTYTLVLATNNNM